MPTVLMHRSLDTCNDDMIATGQSPSAPVMEDPSSPRHSQVQLPSQSLCEPYFSINGLSRNSSCVQSQSVRRESTRIDEERKCLTVCLILGDPLVGILSESLDQMGANSYEIDNGTGEVNLDFDDEWKILCGALTLMSQGSIETPLYIELSFFLFILCFGLILSLASLAEAQRMMGIH